MNIREIGSRARMSHSRVSRFINEALIGFATPRPIQIMSPPAPHARMQERQGEGIAVLTFSMEEQLAKFPIDGAMDFRY